METAAKKKNSLALGVIASMIVCVSTFLLSSAASASSISPSSLSNAPSIQRSSTTRAPTATHVALKTRVEVFLGVSLKSVELLDASPANATRYYDDSWGVAIECLVAPISGARNPGTIRFSQDSARRTFSDGRSIDELVEGLSSGRVKPGDVPPIRLVEREGHLISIDNRRLEAFRRAGVDAPTRMATPAEIEQAIRQGKFSAGPLGSPTIRIRGDNP